MAAGRERPRDRMEVLPRLHLALALKERQDLELAEVALAVAA